MDLIQDYVHQLLSTLDPTTLATYTPYLYRLTSTLTLLRSWALVLVDQVSQKPDLATIALLLVIVFVSLKILNMLWQTVVFWVRMVRSVVFWGGLVGLGLWMWTRGLEGVVEDVGYWGAVWQGEYGRLREREREVMGGGGVGGMGGGARGPKGWL